MYEGVQLCMLLCRRLQSPLLLSMSVTWMLVRLWPFELDREARSSEEGMDGIGRVAFRCDREMALTRNYI